MKSTGFAIVIGVLVAGMITAPIAYLNATQYGNASFYWKIILPGALVGAIVGYVTMRYGRPAAIKALESPSHAGSA